MNFEARAVCGLEVRTTDFRPIIGRTTILTCEAVNIAKSHVCACTGKAPTINAAAIKATEQRGDVLVDVRLDSYRPV